MRRTRAFYFAGVLAAASPLQVYVALAQSLAPSLTNSPQASSAPASETPVPVEQDKRATLSLDDIVLISGGALVCLLVIALLWYAARSLSGKRVAERPPASARTVIQVDHSYGSFLT